MDLTIRITREQSVNAIVSGIFLDKLAYPSDCPEIAGELRGTKGNYGAGVPESLSEAAERALAEFEADGSHEKARAYMQAEWDYFHILREAEAKSAKWYYGQLTGNYADALERLRRFQAKADFSAEYVTAQGLIHRARHALLDWPRAGESLAEWADLITTLVTTERTADAVAQSATADSLPPAKSAGDSAPNTTSNCPTCPKSHSPPSAPVINPPRRVFDHEPSTRQGASSTINHAVIGLRRLAGLALDVAHGGQPPAMARLRPSAATPLLGYLPRRERSERWQLASHLAENFAVLATANLAPDTALSEARRFAQAARAKAHAWLGVIALEHLLYRSPSPDTRHPSPAVRLALAKCYLDDRRPADAVREFELALPRIVEQASRLPATGTVAPHSLELRWAWRDYALCLARCGRDADAQAALAQLALLVPLTSPSSPSSPSSDFLSAARHLLAFAALERGDPKAALAEYQRLAQTQPEGRWRDRAKAYVETLQARLDARSKKSVSGEW
ncbi:MAG: hypothetical protein FJ279_14220 [Planctomycetes bacterium]|nr:hypothetical protein [Planctomycetota bacterium]